MAFPIVAASNTSATSPSATNHVIALPGGISAGDLLLIAFSRFDTSTITPAAGWTLVSGDGASTGIWGRIATGSEGASVNFTSSANTQSAHISLRVTGHFSSAALSDVIEGGWNNTSLDPPNLTPSWGSADFLWVVMARTRRTDNTVTAPTNYSSQVGSQSVADGSSLTGVGRIATATRDLAAASENPGTWGSTGTLNGPQSGTFAVRPLAPLPPPDPPEGVTATAVSPSCIDVDWDNVTGNTGYRVERSLDGVSGWVTAGTTGTDETTFPNCGLDADTEYCYRVIALGASGESDPSDVECATTFPAPVGLSVDNPTLGNFWVHAYEGDYSICAQTVAWTRTRPFGSVQPIEGGPPVTVTGRPGLRDYAFTIAVNSTADMITVENIIAHPLVFVQFAGHHPDQWMAPQADSYQVIKVGRNRLATVQFVGVEPEPVPSPGDFL